MWLVINNSCHVCRELRPLLSNVDDRRDPTTLSPAEQMRSLNHEQLVMEISELVHRQLVSSALSGNIRDRLESHVLVSLSAVTSERHLSTMPSITETCNNL